ncbi:hypothetical protein POVWA2_054670 [Plasmodium ovale wallikeri]|uniref:Uncharacterized protein n=1 Tax=Plasmodium ovale wallikeri TaxID=864142 RepID=A0A1A8ZUV3_PLAOA|nr:hypothetical protein POVWA1_056060 [Plasmodium ovale wallikeri]SBT47722.1 hypothetical protein POVWA2_054670 [Plasmodium ovale wallikeri]
MCGRFDEVLGAFFLHTTRVHVHMQEYPRKGKGNEKEPKKKKKKVHYPLKKGEAWKGKKQMTHGYCEAVGIYPTMIL